MSTLGDAIVSLPRELWSVCISGSEVNIRMVSRQRPLVLSCMGVETEAYKKVLDIERDVENVLRVVHVVCNAPNTRRSRGNKITETAMIWITGVGRTYHGDRLLGIAMRLYPFESSHLIKKYSRYLQHARVSETTLARHLEVTPHNRKWVVEETLRQILSL